MVQSMMKPYAGTGAECGGHDLTYGAEGARRSFMKLAAATATLTGVAMTARMTVKAFATGEKNADKGEPCRSSDGIGAVCTACTVACTVSAEV